MSGIALARYLSRHIEKELPQAPPGAGPWQHVLVIPAYDESPALLQRLALYLTSPEATLVILVLNRPDSAGEADPNKALRDAVRQAAHNSGKPSPLIKLNENADLYLFDMESELGPTPASQGVGLARKMGCDLALSWHHCGLIKSDWLCSSDADAVLPPDYFARLEETADSTVAATFPFTHSPGEDISTHQATVLYELRLHHYVLGLESAGSPYAYHTLGSSLAIRCDNYAQVRGFPKRAGGEDFYLLNKVAKTGAIARLKGQCIELESRESQRVPFGTGPAVGKILDNGKLTQQRLFYHPQCFAALGSWLAAMPRLSSQPLEDLPGLLTERGLPEPLTVASCDALNTMGLEAALAHCRRQGKTQDQFERQFHQWFDGFRTLKFIHALRDSNWPDHSLGSLATVSPSLWPLPRDPEGDLESMRAAIHQHWGWFSP